MHPRDVKRSSDDTMNGRTRTTMAVGKIMAIVFLLLVFVPFFLFLLTRLVRNWNWWKVKNPKYSYVKTWHGWMRQRPDEKAMDRGWHGGGTSRTAHRVRITWTPEGSTVHHAPRHRLLALPQQLLQCVGLHNSDMRDSDRSADVEMGCIPEPPAIRIISATPANTVSTKDHQASTSVDQVDGPSDGRGHRTSHVMSGGLRYSSGTEHAEDTVRRRRDQSSSSTAWQANSSETTRATHEQFIKPLHGFRTPLWAETLFGNSASGDTTTPISSRETTGIHPQPECSLDPQTNSAQGTSSQTMIARRGEVKSSPELPPRLASSPVTDLRSTQVSAGIDLDNLNTYLESGSRYGSYKTETSSSALSTFRQFTPPTLLARSQSLTQRLKPRIKRPSFSSLFLNPRRGSIKETQPDDLGRGVAAEGTLFTVGDENDVKEHVKNEHIIEPSIDGATSYYEDVPGSWPKSIPSRAGILAFMDNHRDITHDTLGSSEYSDTHQPLRSITNSLIESASMPAPLFSAKRSKPQYSSISPRKRGSPTKHQGLMGPNAPEIKPQCSFGRTTLIPSVRISPSCKLNLQRHLDEWPLSRTSLRLRSLTDVGFHYRYSSMRA